MLPNVSVTMGFIINLTHLLHRVLYIVEWGNQSSWMIEIDCRCVWNTPKKGPRWNSTHLFVINPSTDRRCIIPPLTVGAIGDLRQIYYLVMTLWLELSLKDKMNLKKTRFIERLASALWNVFRNVDNVVIHLFFFSTRLFVASRMWSGCRTYNLGL